MRCENCAEEHDGSYGSGRFCNSRCARSFSTGAKRKEINEKVSIALKGRMVSHNHGFKKGYDPRRKKFTAQEYRGTGKKNSDRMLQKQKDLSWMDCSLPEKRRRILVEQNHCCNKCGLKEWQGVPLVLEMDHIDGDSGNYAKDNLEFLCPNCHSLTKTWRGRNIDRPSKGKVSDGAFIKALQENDTVRAALVCLGLAPRGGNYARAYRLLERVQA